MLQGLANHSINPVSIKFPMSISNPTKGIELDVFEGEIGVWFSNLEGEFIPITPKKPQSGLGHRIKESAMRFVKVYFVRKVDCI